MSNVQIFSNPTFGDVRTLEENGKILFCGSDVAKGLGYANSRKALSDHCRCVTKRYTPHPQAQDKQIEMAFIPEGDIYRLITHSKLPAAEQFESWVFDEVLPTIRKTGMYATEELLDNPDLFIKTLQALKEAREKSQALTLENIRNKQIIGELQPKATYYDRILANKGLVTVTQIAKDYGKSAKWMNAKLHELGVQFKQSGQWLLYARYHSKGYTHSSTTEITRTDGRPDVVMETKWTQKGRLFLYELLKGEGVLPVIEQEPTD